MPVRIYIETTIIGYLAMKPSNDVLVAAHQQITHRWWSRRRGDFELVSSQAVAEECRQGDPEAARDRLAVLADLRLLDVTESASELASRFVGRGPLPPKAAFDALHIALAAVNGLDYLLTWNCRHIANAAHRPAIEDICRNEGFEPPIICTPEELPDG